MRKISYNFSITNFKNFNRILYQVYTIIDLVAMPLVLIYSENHIFMLFLDIKQVAFSRYVAALTTSLEDRFKGKEKERERKIYMFLMRGWVFEGSTFE